MFRKILICFLAVGLSCSAFANKTQNDYKPPTGVTVLSDIAYGDHKKQTLDVYFPQGAKNAPAIFMIHGGAWRGGDKTNKGEFVNKVAHWVTKGFIFVSTNYRALPELGPLEQTEDIVAALKFAQQHASKWGAAHDKFILMGHSSGAHLVSLVSAKYNSVTKTGINPWLGTVSLDISGYDIVKKVTGENPSEFYLDIFGRDPAYWPIASPFQALVSRIPPFLAVCSIRSRDACQQAENFLKKARNFGGTGQLLPVDFGHMPINSELGKGSCYTDDVDTFLKTLSPDVAALLINEETQLQRNCTKYR